MAKEKLKQAGVFTMAGVLITVVIFLLKISWAGSGRLTKVEAKAETTKNGLNTHITTDEKRHDKADTERAAIKDAASEARLRDERIAGQYTEITSYMRVGAETTKQINVKLESLRETQASQATIQAVNSEKLNTLTKE